MRPYPAGATAYKWQVSPTGCRFPVWSKDRQLFFQGPDGRMMVASYQANGQSFAAGPARVWSPTPVVRTNSLRSFDLAPDGKKFIAYWSDLSVDAQTRRSVHITVLLNFFDELKRRLP